MDIRHVRRGTRDGYKAGALAEGMRQGTGELIAVFDADFVPAPDVLAKLLPPFEDARVGAVQARWGYLNEAESALTRVQAFLLDMHFRLEQPARNAQRLFLNFNGTAGVWRRTAVEDAGGWSSRTVTEDIDLSYRAQQRGWRIVYLDDCVVRSELPGDMTALRSQQHRWIMGGAQNARLHLGPVLRSRASRAVRWHAVQHLVASSIYVVILIMLILSVPLAAMKNTAITADYQDFGIPFVMATAGLGWALYIARRPRGARELVRFAVLLAAFLTFTMGLAVANGAAALKGWFGHGGVVRTAKAGSVPWDRSPYAGRRIDRRVLPEIGIVLWLVLGLVVAAVRREPALAPLQLMGLAGTGWVLVLSVLGIRSGLELPMWKSSPPVATRNFVPLIPVDRGGPP